MTRKNLYSAIGVISGVIIIVVLSQLLFYDLGPLFSSVLHPANANESQTNSSPINMVTSVTVIPPNEKIPTVLSNVQLNMIGNSTKGIGSGPQTGSAGTPVAVYDTSNLRLTLYGGQYSNGTGILVVEATNIGQSNLTISLLMIQGWNPNVTSTTLSASVIGCTSNTTQPGKEQNISNTSTLVTTVTYTIVCPNPAASPQVTLTPGQAFTAFTTSPTDFKASNGVQISHMLASGHYWIDGKNALFGISTDQP